MLVATLLALLRLDPENRHVNGYPQAAVVGQIQLKRSWTRHGFRKFEDEELKGLLREAGFTDVVIERDGVRVFSGGRRP